MVVCIYSYTHLQYNTHIYSIMHTFTVLYTHSQYQPFNTVRSQKTSPPAQIRQTTSACSLGSPLSPLSSLPGLGSAGSPGPGGEPGASGEAAGPAAVERLLGAAAAAAEGLHLAGHLRPDAAALLPAHARVPRARGGHLPGHR